MEHKAKTVVIEQEKDLKLVFYRLVDLKVRKITNGVFSKYDIASLLPPYCS